MTPGQLLEQSPADPRVSCTPCLGTGFLDAARLVRHDLCHASGLVTRDRLAAALAAGEATPAGEPLSGLAGGPGGPGTEVPGFQAAGYPA